MIPNVLSIAGSDPSGGAGIQADLKTFAALGCYGMAAITALTAQNTKGVSGFEAVSADFVRKQIEMVFEDISVDAVKIGMTANAEIILAIAECLRRYKPAHIVLDPVMVATSGDTLISDDAIAVLKSELVPLASLVTPNKAEAKILGDVDVPVLLKGGHDDGDQAVDILVVGGQRYEFSAPRVDTKNTHGTGCTLSSATAAYLAMGEDLQSAIQSAKTYLTGALQHADELGVGLGHGPVHHGWKS